MDPCVGACCDEGWQALVRAHAARTDTLRRGGGDHRAIILWQPQGQGAGGFAWEVRFMLLAFLAALATDRTLVLGWHSGGTSPALEPFPAPALLPLALPAFLGGHSASDRSHEAERLRERRRSAEVAAAWRGAEVFRSGRGGCWTLGLPYQYASVAEGLCAGKKNAPPWLGTLRLKLAAEGKGGLDAGKWLGCAFRAATVVNSSRMAQLLPQLLPQPEPVSALVASADGDASGVCGGDEEVGDEGGACVGGARGRVGSGARGSGAGGSTRGLRPWVDIAIHVRTGAADFGGLVEAEIREALRAPSQLQGRAAEGGAGAPPLELSKGFDFAAFAATQRADVVRTSAAAATAAAACASNLTAHAPRPTLTTPGTSSSAGNGQEAGQQDGGQEPRAAVRWVIASDSPAVRRHLAAAAQAAGAVPVTSRLSVIEEAGETGGAVATAADEAAAGAGAAAAHHTRYRDGDSHGDGGGGDGGSAAGAVGAGDAAALADLLALGLSGDNGDEDDHVGGGNQGGGGGGQGSSALHRAAHRTLVAAHSSVVPAGSAFAALAAVLGDLPLVFIVGPPPQAKPSLQARSEPTRVSVAAAQGRATVEEALAARAAARRPREGQHTAAGDMQGAGFRAFQCDWSGGGASPRYPDAASHF